MEMTREMAIGKIHRASSPSDLHYVGSITVDEDLLDAANIVPGQKVDIVDVQRRAPLDLHDRGRARQRHDSAQRRGRPQGDRR